MGLPVSLSGATPTKTADDDSEATLADDEVQLFDDGIFEEDVVAGEAQQEESSEAALASSAADLHHGSVAAATLAPCRLSARQGRPRIVGAWWESVSPP